MYDDDYKDDSDDESISDDDPTYASDLDHAWNLYHEGVNAEGSLKKSKLQKAMNVLYLIPRGYRDSDELREKIKHML